MVRVKLFPAAQQDVHEIHVRMSLNFNFKFFYFFFNVCKLLFFFSSSKQYFTCSTSNHPWLLSRCSLWIKRPPLLMARLRIWFRLLRECVPDCPKGLTAIVYCSTRQDLAPICVEVRAEWRGAASRSGPSRLREKASLVKQIKCERKDERGNRRQKWKVLGHLFIWRLETFPFHQIWTLKGNRIRPTKGQKRLREGWEKFLSLDIDFCCKILICMFVICRYLYLETVTFLFTHYSIIMLLSRPVNCCIPSCNQACSCVIF